MKSIQINKNISKDNIKWLFETGVYEIEDVIKYVEFKIITKDEFHSITSYDYDGYCKTHNI